MHRFTLLLSLALPAIAAARPGGQGFGMGLALGEPTGINFKQTLGSSTALDATLGLNFLNGRGFSVHLCVLWEVPFATMRTGQLNGYLGLGGKLGAYTGDDDQHRGQEGENSIWLGGRAPAGLAFVLSGAPVDIWLEVAAVLWAVEEPGLDLDGTVGVRYWF